jgi:hypothetical protein
MFHLTWDVLVKLCNQLPAVTKLVERAHRVWQVFGINAISKQNWSGNCAIEDGKNQTPYCLICIFWFLYS